MKKNGYTLVELIIAFGILGVIGSIIIGILTTSLRTSGKSQELETVRQNGDYAISQIEKTLRFAQAIDGVSTDAVTYSCSSTGNSYIRFVTFNPPPYNRSVISCVSPTIAQDGQSFLDTNTVTLTYCSISCTPDGNGGPPTVGINFTLKLNSGSTQPVNFQSSIKLRNSN